MRRISDEEFYFVCAGCDCKFFSKHSTEKCPRCGQPITSSTTARPPWLPRLYRPDEIAQVLRCGLSTVYGLLESGALVGHRCPGWRVDSADLAAYLAKTRREPARAEPAAGPRPRLKHVRM